MVCTHHNHRLLAISITNTIFIMAASIYPPGYSATVDDVASLHSDLFRNYKRIIPPVYQQNHAVQVKLSLFLLMIHDLDMKNQVLTTSGWLNVNWGDEFLQWNQSDYGGVEEITVSQSQVWLPDILVENTAKNFDEIGSDSILVSVQHDGHISWEPGILTKTICEVNIGKYPFDRQTCEIKFLTWMHTNKTLDVQPGADLVSLDACISNGEWHIISAVARPYFYPSTYKYGTAHTGVSFVIELKRKRTFYVLNTIIPVMMLSLLNVLVFLLPASSGEKMALAVTVLLSFTVYLSIISEVMPKTSESISILAVYLTILLSLSTMSVLSSGLVMNMIHRDTDRPVPRFLRTLVCLQTRRLNNQTRNGSLRPRSGQRSSICSRKKADEANIRYSDACHVEIPASHWLNGEHSKRRHCTRDPDGVRVFPMRKYSARHADDPFSDDNGALSRDEERVVAGGKGEGFPMCCEHSCCDEVNHSFDETAQVTWYDIGSAIDTLLFWLFLVITLTSTATVLFLFSIH